MRPQLKAIAAARRHQQVVLARRPLEELVLADEDGAVAALIQVLAEGRLTVAELPSALLERGYDVSEADLADAIEALDDAGVLLQADSDAGLSAATRRRHESNLRFYDIFADLHRTSADIHTSMTGADVLLLGAGGLGSGVLQSLAGLGAGRIRLVDFDRVEEKNLARQFAYGLDEVGRPKVAAAREWAKRYAPGVVVDAIHQRITDAESIRRLGAGADVVVCAIDSPAGVQLLVNEACFALGVPYVVGGLRYSTLFYYSVEPGVSPCRRCLELRRADQAREMPERGNPDLLNPAGQVNRATGPIAQLLAGFVTLEAVRYVTRTDPPVAAATYHTIDLADGMRAERAPWARHADCPLCRNPA
jgi:molybdopterin/thiamine biosynthesis adenylyltransferase